MKICHLATELSPIAKVGGLADVTLGLSRETQKLGHQVFTILPKYSCLHTQELQSLSLLPITLNVDFNNKCHTCKVYKGLVYGVLVYFIDPISPKSYFKHKTIYGHSEDALRFAFFSLAAVQFLALHHPDLDILHLHDWQVALSAPILKHLFAKELSPSLIFTIHNLNYQGQTHWSLFKKIGFSPENKLIKKFFQDPKKATKANLIKGALYYADRITTVSPKYAQEILSPKLSKGLQKALLDNRSKLKGIINGIDYDIWSPKKDPFLKHSYTEKKLHIKYKLKNELRAQLRMPLSENTLLVTCICRLVPQKGLKMIKKAITSTLKKGGQFILFGSSPIEKIQTEFNELKKQLAHNPNVKFIFKSYNEPLAHQIYAGADLIICPSIFEPCGLTQLIAMRYGTLPLVRKTGGLANTVFDLDQRSKKNLPNGFSFNEPTCLAIDKKLKRAFEIYLEHPKKWKELITHAMNTNSSWECSAKEYLNTYSKSLQKKVPKKKSDLKIT